MHLTLCLQSRLNKNTVSLSVLLLYRLMSDQLPVQLFISFLCVSTNSLKNGGDETTVWLTFFSPSLGSLVRRTTKLRSDLRLQCGDVVSYLLGLGEKVLDDWLLLKQNGLRPDDLDGRRVRVIPLLRDGVGIFTGRLGDIVGPLQLRQAVPHGGGGPSGRSQ